MLTGVGWSSHYCWCCDLWQTAHIFCSEDLELYLPTGESPMATTICQWSAESMVSQDACLSTWSTVLSFMALSTSAALRKEPSGSLPWNTADMRGSSRAMLMAVFSVKAESLSNVTKGKHLPDHHLLLLFHKKWKGFIFFKTHLSKLLPWESSPSPPTQEVSKSPGYSNLCTMYW